MSSSLARGGTPARKDDTERPLVDAAPEWNAREYRASWVVAAIGFSGLLFLTYVLGVEHGMVPFQTGRSGKLSLGSELILIAFILLALYLVQTRRWRFAMDRAGIHVRGFLVRKQSLHWDEILLVRERHNGLEVRGADGRRIRLPSYAVRQGKFMRVDLRDYLVHFAPTAHFIDWRRASFGLPMSVWGMYLEENCPGFVYAPLRVWMSASRVLIIFSGLCFVGFLAVGVLRRSRGIGIELQGYLVAAMLGSVFCVFVITECMIIRLKQTIRKLSGDLCWKCGYDLGPRLQERSRCPECAYEMDAESLRQKWRSLRVLVEKPKKKGGGPRNP